MLQLQLEGFQQLLKNYKTGARGKKTIAGSTRVNGVDIPVFVNEFWTSAQRQANALHEISYRACFKPQLPRFFIEALTHTGQTVYDPFSGRGTTVVEAALLGRHIIANDANPVSLMLTKPRIGITTMQAIEKRLAGIKFSASAKSDIDLTMFYHPATLAEIISLKKYLHMRAKAGKEDITDQWIRMVATNRLTGHSPGFFSVYTLPPNQAMSAGRQKKVNRQRRQTPEYRDVKKLILRKSKALLKDMGEAGLHKPGRIKARFLNESAAHTPAIKKGSVALTVTSPPFLDVVQYADDNWLRCWFNGIDVKKIERNITMSKTVAEWSTYMQRVFNELYRITQKGGWVAFEVGEVRKGKIKLEEAVVPLGLKAGFDCAGIMINEQHFTKTANIWGIANNSAGTNSNRIVIFRKG
jgi:DNA methylase